MSPCALTRSNASQGGFLSPCHVRGKCDEALTRATGENQADALPLAMSTAPSYAAKSSTTRIDSAGAPAGLMVNTASELEFEFLPWS